MNDIQRMREKKAAAAAAAAKASKAAAVTDDGPPRAAVAIGFLFVVVLVGLAFYFIHALNAPPAPILPPH